MSNFEQLARFVPLAENNTPALSIDQVKALAPEDFEFKQPPFGQLYDAKEFYEYEMTLKKVSHWCLCCAVLSSNLV